MMRHFTKLGLLIFLGTALSLPAATTVTNLFAGSLQSFLVRSDGSLWAAGANSDGQLGSGNYNTTYRFIQVRTNFASFVATGGNHTLLLNQDGSLAVTGDDSYGDLGDGGSNPVNAFKGLLIIPSGVMRIAAGVNHSMFVKNNGSLWGMGLNTQAQLGDGTLNNTNRPEQIVPNNVANVSCGSSATFFVQSNGFVLGMGLLNNFRYDLNVYTPQPVLFGGASTVVCGAQHALIIGTNGALLAFGANAAGELGDGTTNQSISPEQILTNGVIAAACGASHSHFIKSDGSLWAMGLNNHGELGDGTTNNSLVPEEIVSNSVVAVAAGLGHCLFLKSDGSVWATGLDSASQFGDGFTNLSILTPQQVYPAPAPALTNIIAGISSLQFTARCALGGTYYLLATTNLAQPASQWTRVATNSIGDRYNDLFFATLTNAITAGAPQEFYQLQSP